MALGASSTTAIGVAQVKYPDLTQQADGVVVGKISRAQNSSSGAKLALLVDRVIKGSFTPGETISLAWNGPPPSRAPGQPWGDYGIWFLQSAGPNWRIVQIPAAQSLETSCYRRPEGTLPPATATTGTAAPSPVELMLAELTNAAEKFDPHGFEFIQTIDSFFHMPPSPALTAAFRQMSQSTNPNVKVLGLIGLITGGDSASLGLLPLENTPPLNRFGGGRMGWAISTVRDSAPVTVRELGSIATGKNVPLGIRQCAAEALAKIHTKETLPFAALFLDSQDVTLQKWGLDAFSRFVMNLPIEKPEMLTTMAWMKPQGPAPYSSPETDRHIAGPGIPESKLPEYISFWKAWWSQMQNHLK